VPLVRIGPRDLAILIDRLQVPFGHPAQISGGRGFAATITTEPLPVGFLQKIVEATRGLGPPPADRASGLPYIREKRPD
jgi:hypothetical protein